MAMIDKVKVALRISSATTAYDGEITDLISAAEADLLLSGVVAIDETDVLIIRAVTTYCKANFGWDNPDAERLQSSYNSIKGHLTSSADYTTEVT